jgi:hypothetical protein
MAVPTVIAVDLDHTLIQTDLTKAAARSLWARGGRWRWHLVACVIRGMVCPGSWRVALKNFLVQHVPLDTGALPFDNTVLERVRHLKQSGHRLVLATGAPEAWARQVAACAEKVSGEPGLFEQVIATRETTNMVGARKAEALVACYGDRGFMYYGDSLPDLAVWAVAAGGVAVNPSPRVDYALHTLEQKRPGLRIERLQTPPSEIRPVC